MNLYVNGRVVIRGLKTDSAVLCTKDKTYDIKDTETSNSLLILPECDVGGDVSSGGDEFTVQHRQVCAAVKPILILVDSHLTITGHR